MTTTTIQTHVAIVTGGGSGISLSLVQILLRARFKVVILDLSLGDAADLIELANS